MTSTTAAFNAPPTNVDDNNTYPVPAISGFSNKLSRQRQRQNPAVSQLLMGQQSMSSNDDTSDKQMETSLIFVRNPNLEAEIRTPLNTSTATTTANINRTNNVIPIQHLSSNDTTIPPVHTSKLLAGAKQGNISTASTYAAALAVSSRGSSDKAESLIRGPLAMPLSVLTASTSSYALPSSAPNTCLTKSITSSPLPAHPSTAPSITATVDRANNLNQQIIPGQVIDEVSIGIVVPTSHDKSCNPPPCTTNLKFPASSMLSSTYSGSSSTLSPNSLVGSTSFAIPTPISKYEPELLLSPAKLGQWMNCFNKSRHFMHNHKF